VDRNDPSDASMIEAGGPVSRLSIALRIQGDDLDPSEITSLLRVQPKFAARKGDQVRRGSRAVVQRIGIWTFGLSEQSSPEWELDDVIGALLARLPAEKEIWESLSTRFKLDVFCGLFLGSDNQGADLRPETIRALAERNLALGLDIYGPPPDDEAI
jgi:hypothetical protein